MIETVTMERLDVRAAAGPVRGRHAADRRGGRAGRGRRLPHRARHGRRSPRTRRSSPRTRWTRWPTVPGVRIFGPTDAGRPRRHDVVRASTASTRTTSGQVLDERGVAVRVGHHCARPADARFGVRRRPGPRSTCTRTTDEIDALVRGLEQRCGRCSWRDAARELYQEIILDHYKHPHGAGCGSRSTPRRTTSTRPAATR